MRNVLVQRRAQLVAVLAVQVNLELVAVEGETDSSLCLAAVDVVDEEGLELLSHTIAPSAIGGF